MSPRTLSLSLSSFSSRSLFPWIFASSIDSPLRLVTSIVMHRATKTFAHSWRRLALQSTSGREDPPGCDSLPVRAGERGGGEGCTKGSKGKKGSLALDQLPYPSCSHLLSTCVVRMRLLAVETHPPTTSQLSVATLFSIRAPPSPQTIHDYASRKSSPSVLFRFQSRCTERILVRVVLFRTKKNLEGMDSHFRLKFLYRNFFTSPSLLKYISLVFCTRISKERRVQIFPSSQTFKAKGLNEIAKFPRTLYGLLVHACSGEFTYSRFRILR